MRILPVIDLMGGEVVRGIAGEREQYRPIQSLLCDGSSPAAVGQAFRRLGFEEVYVADLDAIRGAEFDWGSYNSLLDCGLRPWVDAGIGDLPAAIKLAHYRHGEQRFDTLIVGSESLVDSHCLASILEHVEPSRLVFSLDLRRGRPIVACPGWRQHSPERIAEEVIGLGVGRMIVLDLSRVGVGEGIGTLDLCRHLRHENPSLEIISGGGVRSVEDLHLLAAAGCDIALVASALHDGRIAPEYVINATTSGFDGQGQGTRS